MATGEELFQQYEGHFVPYSFQGGFVFLSYAVSLIGVGSTLELIRRQTSNKGFHNLILLTGAAISMGGIAIWAMHYIGNRAIVILNGEPELQIAYSTCLTVVSLFVPLVAQFLAFFLISSHGRVCWVRIILSGALSGATLVGMHYLADASIRNYRPVYSPGYVVGASLIAVIANITVLACFFVFEAAWTNVWWRRIWSANVLAGAVSGVHWCAASGTKYRLLHLYQPADGMSRNSSLIAVICLSVVAFVVLIVSTLYSHWVKTDYARKAQKVVLAAAVFDERGRIMVNQDGLLPSEVITDTFIPTTSNDNLDTSNPVFHWMFWASRNWNRISTVVDSMERHVASLSSSKFARKMKLKLLGDNGEAVDNYSTILCELFCLAASSLSSRMKESLDTSGHLWDEVFTTGDNCGPRRQSTATEFDSKSELPSHRMSSSTNNSQTDLNANAQSDEQGKGSLMFLVRHINGRRDMEHLEAAGFRFAELHHVLDTIHSSMQIKTRDFAARLRHMSNRSEVNKSLTPGVHLGLFAVRARLDYGGFDVLVQKNARNLLPSVPVALGRLEPWHKELLRSLQGLTAQVIVSKLEEGGFGPGGGTLFARQLRDAVASLRLWINDSLFDEARLVPRVIRVPCAPDAEESSCSLIAFQTVLPIYSNLNFQNMEAIPLQFFKIRQHTTRDFFAHGSPSVNPSANSDLDMSIMQFPPNDMPFNPMTGSPAQPTLKELAKPGRPFNKGGPVPTGSHQNLAKRFQGIPSSAHGNHSRLNGWNSSSFSLNRRGEPGSSRGMPFDKRDGASSRNAANRPGQGNIWVSQEVVVDYHESDDGHKYSQASEQPPGHLNLEQGATPRAGYAFAPSVEESYTVTATGHAKHVSEKDESSMHFADELLAFSMKKYNRRHK
ncbi:hypothetical protein HIM_07862 [Hirsutella minnesotensis 3608]|uniref:MHYT domain-containing protein n=1 Tax=Hirsutella minnesotensis 3608 TaxID=1043627 RepID=A0A0F7ZYN6_9HYPO|nr:hypothetical protein HIM_07862 [Hirsutella minnesotensis 3608]